MTSIDPISSREGREESPAGAISRSSVPSCSVPSENTERRLAVLEEPNRRGLSGESNEFKRGDQNSYPTLLPRTGIASI